MLQEQYKEQCLQIRTLFLSRFCEMSQKKQELCLLNILQREQTTISRKVRKAPGRALLRGWIARLTEPPRTPRAYLLQKDLPYFFLV